MFVKGAVSGDMIKARIIKSTSSYLVGRLEEIVIPSSVRADNSGKRCVDCTAPMSCGGCTYRNIKYEYELELKRDQVKAEFKKAGLPDVEVEQTVSTGEVY